MSSGSGVKGGTGGGSLPDSTPAPTPPEALPLLQASSLTFLGSFRVPASQGGENTPAFGGTGLTYFSPHDSLLMVGHDHYQKVGEFTIETPVIAETIAELPRATLLQPFTDILQGKLYTIDGDTSNGVKIGGLTPRFPDESLIVTAWSYYDAGSPKQTRTHFRVAKWDFSTLTPDDVSGPYQVGAGFTGIVDATPEEHAIRTGGFVSGYMCVIPSEWQQAFREFTRLTGQGGGISILTRTSSGPAVSAFDLTPEGAHDPVPAMLLMGYPSDSSNQASDFHHPTLGDWGIDDSGTGLYNGTQTFRGMVFPDHTRSVLFVGWRGTTFCYGPGTDDPALDHVPIEPPQYDADGERVVHCYDPTEPSKGTHGYPCEPCIYAYDANDLLAVQEGACKPWDVVPYATFALPIPFPENFPNAVTLSPAYQLMGAAWDPGRRWLMVSGYRQDGDAPLIHCFKVA